MKLLIFAHTPPPHHGQSYMVQLMLEGFGGDARWKKTGSPAVSGIECYHVNARFSNNLSNVGEFQGGKIFLIFWFCLQALWIRFRYGVKNFYYVPAPGKRVALYRDWIIMFCCRPFFKKIILHWHAAGLAKWLETSAQMHTRALTYRLFRPVNLSIVLSHYNFADAQKLLSHDIRIVNNGIADPCPDFAARLRPIREARAEARLRLADATMSSSAPPQAAGDDSPVVKVLFLAHCMREKGLFDALEGVALANESLKRNAGRLRFHLTVAGSFVSPEERAQFTRRIAQLAADPLAPTTVDYLGFVSGDKKVCAFAASDIFLFPSYYHAESFGLVVVEAMAFGLPIVTTRWRSIPELFPADYPGLVDIQSPAQIARALIQLATSQHNWPVELRNLFQKNFTIEQHLVKLAETIRTVETTTTPAGAPQPHPA